MLATSCPRCASEAPTGASRCEGCGFVFLEGPRRRRFPRPGPLGVAMLTVAAALLAGTLALVTRSETAAAPQPPEPMGPTQAQHRLERQLANAGYDDTVAVRCRRAVRLAATGTRCHVRYANGDTQLILVALDERGELDITIPYPAQRRPGG